MQSPQVDLAQLALRDASANVSAAADLHPGMQIMLGKSCRRGTPCFGCVDCHGIRGEGAPKAGVPRLAAQSDVYLYRSLRNFRSGTRQSETMQPVAQQLTDAQMREVAVWYAAQRSGRPETSGELGSMIAELANAKPSQEVLTRGAQLAAIGSPADGVQGCVNCHGPAGVGEPPTYPYLAGQYSRYLRDQLVAFKQGKRADDPLQIMRQIAGRLDAEDIEALAQYYSAMQPPIALRYPVVAEATELAPQSSPKPAAAHPHNTSNAPVQHRSERSALIGAGADFATTTGYSGPGNQPGKTQESGPPQASLCQSYQGAVRESCWDTVLRRH